LFGQAFERNAGTLGQRGFAEFLFAVFGDVARFFAVGDHDELIARLRQAFEADDFNRGRGRRFLNRLAAVVEHGADFAVDVADHEIVAGVERAVLHQDGADGPRPRSSFASSTNPLAARPGVAFNSWRSAVRQIISISRLRLVFCFAETSTNTVLPPHSSGTRPRSASCFLTRSAGLRVYHLVDGDDDGNLGGVRVVDGFDGLGHDAVIGGGDEHDDVGGFGSARTHAGEGFVTGRIEEDDLAPEGGSDLSVMATLYAPMCWVMPPASPPATLVERMESRSVVLP